MSMSVQLILIVASAAIALFRTVQSETHLASDSLGVSYEFKLHVDAGREECFYQYVEQNASVYVAFQVGIAGASCNDSNHQQIVFLISGARTKCPYVAGCRVANTEIDLADESVTKNCGHVWIYVCACVLVKNVH